MKYNPNFDLLDIPEMGSETSNPMIFKFLSRATSLSCLTLTTYIERNKRNNSPRTRKEMIYCMTNIY